MGRDLVSNLLFVDGEMLVRIGSKVRYKGAEYARLDDIPANIRRPLDRTLAQLTGGRAITARLNSRIIFNGKAVSDPMRLPAEQRQQINDFFAAFVPVETAICLAAVMERKHRIHGTVGLSVIFGGLGAYVVHLWLHGYFG